MEIESKPPPTERQLKRISELIQHPAIQGAYLDSLMPKWDSFISSKGGAGVLINILKKKIGENGFYEGIRNERP
jgi:hypothetical protein